MSIEDLMKPRYKVIAKVPVLPFKEDEVYNCDIVPVDVGKEQFFVRLDMFPHLFKKLEWWEARTLDEMVLVKYVKVVVYVGYWRVGDIVPVVNYGFHDGKFFDYVLKYNHHQKPKTVTPATEEEYNTYINQQK